MSEDAPTKPTIPVPSDVPAKGILNKVTFEAQDPSVGRIVRYHHQEGDDIVDLAAMVTNVANISRASFGAPGIQVVCLTVFDSMGTTFGVQAVKYGEGSGEWSWPPRV